MAALMKPPRMALAASTSGRALNPAKNMPLGTSSFHGVSLSMRQQPRRQRIQQVTCRLSVDQLLTP